jgi:hypothetical protein
MKLASIFRIIWLYISFSATCTVRPSLQPDGKPISTAVEISTVVHAVQRREHHAPCLNKKNAIQLVIGSMHHKLCSMDICLYYKLLTKVQNSTAHWDKIGLVPYPLSRCRIILYTFTPDTSSRNSLCKYRTSSDETCKCPMVVFRSGRQSSWPKPTSKNRYII